MKARSKTYLTIDYSIGRGNCTASFIRERRLKTPTHKGAARMIANHINEEYDCDVKPSEISVQRVQECCYNVN